MSEMNYRERLEELRRKRDREGLSRREADEFARLMARHEKRNPQWDHTPREPRLSRPFPPS